MKNWIEENEIILQVEESLHEYYKLSPVERWGKGTRRLLFKKPKLFYNGGSDVELIICRGIRTGEDKEYNIALTYSLPESGWYGGQCFRVHPSICSTGYGTGNDEFKLSDLSNKEKRKKTAEFITRFLHFHQRKDLIKLEVEYKESLERCRKRYRDELNMKETD